MYITMEQPNGTSDLIITDRDGLVVEVISEALFGVWNRIKELDELGGCVALTNNEYVEYFEYGMEAYEWDDAEDKEVLCKETFVSKLLEYGDYQGVELLKSIGMSTVLKYIAVSPVNDGSEAIKTLHKYFGNVA